MKPEQSEELPEYIEVVTPGTLLREGREACALSQLEVAKKLNLRESQIQAIEDNEFDELPSLTFARGYLRAYAKLVNVKESDVISAFEYWSNAEQQQTEMQSFSNQAKKQSQDHWLLIASLLIGAILIVLAGLWWYQQKEEPTPVTTTSETQSQEAGQSDTPVAEPADETPAPARQSRTTTPRQQQSAQDETEVNDAQVAVSDDAPAEDSPGEPSGDEPQVSGEADAGEIVDVTNEQPDETVPAEPQQAHLELRFSDACWINIEDATVSVLPSAPKPKAI